MNGIFRYISRRPGGTLFLPPSNRFLLVAHGPGLASLRALDQRSIVGSDSMDDAEAAGVERGGAEGEGLSL